MNLLVDGGANLLKYEPVIATAESSLIKLNSYSNAEPSGFIYQKTILKDYPTLMPKKQMSRTSIFSIFLFTILVVLLLIAFFQHK